MSIVSARTAEERLTLYRQHRNQYDLFLERLQEWNSSVNLISRNRELDPLKELLLPSLACADSDLIPFSAAGVDLGSGGGFPGLVLAVVRPDLTILLTERIRKKVSFLRLMTKELNLANVTVFGDDLFALPGNQQYDFVSARYFSDIGIIYGFASRYMRRSGSMLLFKPDEEAENLSSEGWKITNRVSIGEGRSLYRVQHDNTADS